MCGCSALTLNKHYLRRGSWYWHLPHLSTCLEHDLEGLFQIVAAQIFAQKWWLLCHVVVLGAAPSWSVSEDHHRKNGFSLSLFLGPFLCLLWLLWSPKCWLGRSGTCPPGRTYRLFACCPCPSVPSDLSFRDFWPAQLGAGPELRASPGQLD